MTDQDVRDMLTERASAIRPSADGLTKIEAKLAAEPRRAAARRFPMPALAAAAVLAVALIGTTLFVQRDDDTLVDSGPVASAPAVDLPLGVWPWPGDDVDAAVFDDPVDTARAYVASVVLDPGATTDSGFQPADARKGEVVFSGDVTTTVAVREGDDGWYVVGARSDLVTVDTREDGSFTYATGGSGDLTISIGSPGGEPIVTGPTHVEPGPKAAVGLIGVNGPLTVNRARFTLVTAEGVTGITEIRVEQAPNDGETTETTLPETAALPPGVWPFPQDDVSAADLTDPVETARAYVDARVGISDRTTVSDYQAGDNSSGEVVFGGDIDTTVFVRQLDGVWHVEGAASELVTLHDDDGDGSLTAVVEASGWLQAFSVVSTGTSEPLVPAAQHEEGDEITEGLAYDLNTDRAVKAVRFLLTTGEDGIKGLTEVAFRPPFAETAVPENAVWSEGGLDARELVVAYLDDRLGGREVVVDDFTMVGDDVGEVTWEAGIVTIVRSDGYWYVVEALGDSVQIEGASLDVGYVGGSLTLAQAGTVHLSVGDTTWDVRNDVDGEGTNVPFEHEVSTDSPVILRAVFETDTGFVSLAERVIG